ncbi:segregation and condensation protein B [Tistlia consotensis]|uniref:Condensin subunit ScpB n=1 Tax=Tistlia consotensis USBA 355 TaxID=560819 RepID=A0A1Y6BQD0_9PROT|nr:SMC-Scp complex subunit ScpB [Tistlia consotensis]SMF14188.1 condensin subunit ScpB [Tistlia consotensis USBA 355]SNR49725.1 segregation and condensation protein B [Tistlia consotensis]
MSEDRFQRLRLLEALLFAAAEPLAPAALARHFPEGTDLVSLLEELQGLYANRGVQLLRLGERWAFRTAPDLAGAFEIERTTTRKLTRAAIETLAIVAYHQPVTRGEIEEIRGVALSKGTLDTLLEAGWIRPRGRRRTPGKPVTWGTSDAFLEHFGLESLDSLPGIEELKAAGLLDPRPAVTILGERGLLPPPTPIDRDEGDRDEDKEEDLLGDDFGEDLLPEELELPEEERE